LLFSFDRLTQFVINYKTEKLKIYNEKTRKEESLSFNDPKITDIDKVDYINSLISDGVAEKFVGKLNNKFKTIDIPSKFQFIKTDNKNITSEQYILFLKDFTKIFSEYKQTVKYYDVIGTFYSEFLRYSAYPSFYMDRNMFNYEDQEGYFLEKDIMIDPLLTYQDGDYFK
jgi:hypothetical protein